MANKLLSIVSNYIHEGKQFSESRDMLYLTVKRIGKIASGGSLDFGGSEYKEAEIEWIEPEKKSPDDKYGWWDLSKGSYWVVYNEEIDLPENTTLFFQPWEKAVLAGITHPSGIISEPRKLLATLVSVGDYTVGIKENARLSEVFII